MRKISLKARTKQALKKRTKKEKAKAKELLSNGKMLPEVRKEILDEHDPERTCFVCERTGRGMRMVGLNKHRCAECYPGSPEWLDYWERQSEAQKKSNPNGQFLYDNKRGVQ